MNGAAGFAEFLAEVRGGLKLNPDFWGDWALAQAVSRYEHAQPIGPLNSYCRIPSMKTSSGGFVMADTSYYDAEDRSICESVRVEREIVPTFEGDAK